MLTLFYLNGTLCYDSDINFNVRSVVEYVRDVFDAHYRNTRSCQNISRHENIILDDI